MKVRWSPGARVVVNNLNKMVYRIADDTIHIADFWDTRREPQKQAQQLKDNESEILES